MPEELCQVSAKSHYGVLAQHSDPSPCKITVNCDICISCNTLLVLWFVVTACANQTKLKLDQNIFANIGEIKCDREPEVGTEVDG